MLESTITGIIGLAGLGLMIGFGVPAIVEGARWYFAECRKQKHDARAGRSRVPTNHGQPNETKMQQ